MLDFFKNNFFTIFYGITLVLSIIKLPKYYDSFLKFLPIIIGYTLLTELLGSLIYSLDDFTLFSIPEKSYYNVILYNIYDLIFFPFFYYVYWHSISNHRMKMFIKLGAYLFVLAMLVNAFLISPLEDELWYAYVIGTVILITAILTYLYSLKAKSRKSPLYRNLLFWFSIGLLVFHVIYLPITLIKNISLELNLEDYDTLKSIQLYVIIGMYSCFILGFLVMKRIRPIEEM